MADRPGHVRRRGRAAVAAVALALLFLAACGGNGASSGGLPVAAPGTLDTTTSTTSTSVPPTTEAATAVTAPAPAAAPAAPAGLGPGARGPAVAALEAKLASLHYEVGAVDDTYDQDTAYAVTAFQKVTGTARTGRATDDVVAAVQATSTSPAPLVPGGGATRVEIDLARQVLYLYEGNALSKILTVSSGSGARFCSQGYCRRAITNPGSFKIYRQAKGWEKSPLGQLYNPLYFDGGIAVHGSPSVPASPVSHGCVRIPMHAAEWFPSRVSLGTPVYVAGTDGSVPAPLPDATPPPTDVLPGSTVPPATAPPASTTTTTTRPPCLLLCPPPAP